MGHVDPHRVVAGVGAEIVLHRLRDRDDMIFGPRLRQRVGVVSQVRRGEQLGHQERDQVIDRLHHRQP